VQWEEPFGLVMVEAMACGTPVVALRRGSVPEIVADGESGSVVDDEAGLVRAIDFVDLLDRRRCRARAELFDTTRINEDYEASHRAVIEGRELSIPARPDDPMLVLA
jgi:glycosyltransferase involved in cell wall biosynthesis